MQLTPIERFFRKGRLFFCCVILFGPCLRLHCAETPRVQISLPEGVREVLRKKLDAAVPREFQPFVQGEQFEIFLRMATPPASNSASMTAYVFASRGFDFLQQHNYRQSRWYFDKALSSDSQCAAAYLGRVAVDCESGDAQACIRDCDKGLLLEPDFSVFYFARGVGKSLARNYREALPNLAKAIELTPKADIAYLALAASYAGLSNCPAAEEDLKHALELNPSSKRYYNVAGQVEFSCQRMDDALKDLTQAIESKSTDGETYLCRGKILRDRQNFSDALKDFDRAVKLRPRSTQALWCRGDVRKQMGDYEGALKDRLAICKVAPNNANNYFWAAMLCQQLRDHRRALELLNQTLRIDPADQDAYMMRISTKRRLQDYPGALADIEKGVKMFPDGPAFHSERGIIFRDTGELESALRECTLAIEMSTNLPLYLSQRGWVEYDKGDYVAAEKDFMSALGTTDPKSVHDYDALGLYCALLRRGDAGAARSSLARLLESKFANDTNKWFLSLASFATDNLSEAELFKTASAGRTFETREHLCEGYFYAATKQLAAGNLRVASKYFQKCRSTGVNYFHEYASAFYELKRFSGRSSQAENGHESSI